MHYYKARIYSPTLGRFLQTDPIGYKDQMNLYAYLGNDFANKIDPDGLARCDKYSWCTYIDYTVNRSSSNSPSYTPYNGMNQALVTSEQALENVEMGVATASLVITPELVAARAATGAPRGGATVEKMTKTWKAIEKERQNSANKYMTTHGKVADGAKKLLNNIQKNGVPNDLDKEAFSLYRTQIQSVGGTKPVTNSSEVFNTRLEILENILGG